MALSFRSLFAALNAALLLSACSGESPASGPENAGPDAATGSSSDAGSGTDGSNAGPEQGPGTGTSTNGALKIVSLTSTVSKLQGGTLADGETAEVTFVAIVTDTKGLDTIAGGQLIDDTGATYAAFGAGANKGTYTASVGWGQINTVRAIDFANPGGERNFAARFFDNDGNTATAPLTITFACTTDEGPVGACAGSCVNTALTAAHCGACGTPCAKGEVCRAGACTTAAMRAPGSHVTECIDLRSVVSASSCLDVCQKTDSSLTCTSKTSLYSYYDAACTNASALPLACVAPLPTDPAGRRYFNCACN